MPSWVVSKEDEKHWQKAKRLAAKEGHGKDWDYITGIYKRMKGGTVWGNQKESVDFWIHRMAHLLSETSLVSSPPDNMDALAYGDTVAAQNGGREPKDGDGYGEFPPPQDPRHMDARNALPIPRPSQLAKDREDADKAKQTPGPSPHPEKVKNAVKGIAAAQAAHLPPPGAIVFKNESGEREFELSLVENEKSDELNKSGRGNVANGTTRQWGGRGETFIMTPQGWKYMSVKERGPGAGEPDGSLHASHPASNMEGPSSQVSRGLTPPDAVKALVKHIKGLKPRKPGPVVRGSKRKGTV